MTPDPRSSSNGKLAALAAWASVVARGDTDAEARAYPASQVLLWLKRVRNPDVVSLEEFEHLLRQSHAPGIAVWLTGVQTDLLDPFGRLHFSEWLPSDRVFPQGANEDSAIRAAIRSIRAELHNANALAVDKLFYLV